MNQIPLETFSNYHAQMTHLENHSKKTEQTLWVKQTTQDIAFPKTVWVVHSEAIFAKV